MRQFGICIVFAVLTVISATRYETKLIPIEHRVHKREEVRKHERDPKIFEPLGTLYPVKAGTDFAAKANISRSFDVSGVDGRSRPFQRHPQNRDLNGLLQLVPPSPSSHWNHIPRGHKQPPRDGRHRMRYYNGRPRSMRSRPYSDAGGGPSKWFFGGNNGDQATSGSHKKTARYLPHRPPSYQSFPPYWSTGPSQHSKFNSFRQFNKPITIVHQSGGGGGNLADLIKKECDSCNSVPWTPLLKPSAVHESFGSGQSYGVPTIEVHHDSHAYASDQQKSVVGVSPQPAPVHENVHDSTISESFGLPLGNIPTAHGLLPPIRSLKINPVGLVPPPPTILNPVPADGFLQAIPFPELSPLPVVPLHDSNSFQHVAEDTHDLVPPVPPQKSVSNVIFTISEQAPGHGDPLAGNQLNYPIPDPGVLLPVGTSDQHSEPSSLVNSQVLSHVQGFHQFSNPTNHVNLDIVKSVPLAEYTSSIEYPLQIIQSPPIIDIAALPNSTKTDAVAYEKESQTGGQKISDILLGLVKDSSSKNSDSEASGTKVSQHSIQAQPASLPPGSPSSPRKNFPADINSQIAGQGNYFGGNGQAYGQSIGSPSQQYTNTVTEQSVYGQAQNPSQWSNVDHFSFPADNSMPFTQSVSHQPKFEPGVYPDQNSATWLVPAQSNIAAQWILPVSNTPPIPYPILPENQGIASVVNGEFSASPSPQPMNEAKKKIQIIIPYTTGEKKGLDQNALESVQAEGQRVRAPANASQAKPPPSANQTGQWQATNRNHGRKVFGQNAQPQFAELKVAANLTHGGKYLNDVHHVLAMNIKELLKDEVEKPKPEQNIRLQKNIDNWTALEYSNHKTVPKKEPVDVISYATSVTSIPGTSISHLLLTSKKIPEQYLTTTPSPIFDEPKATRFSASSVSVASKPFTTKTYDTSGVYSTVTRNFPSTTTTTQRPVRDGPNRNHRRGYAEVSKTKANQWAKLNENLVLPENVSNKSSDATTVTFPIEKVTPSPDKADVYVVTPVPAWETSSPPGEINRRTTRQASVTEKSGGADAPAKSQASKLFGNKTDRAKISKFNKPKPIQKFFASTKAPPRNITKIEIRVRKDFNESDSEEEEQSINAIFPFRNGGEVPFELAVSNSSSRSNASGKGLVKQVKVINGTKILVDVGDRTSSNGTSSNATNATSRVTESTPTKTTVPFGARQRGKSGNRTATNATVYDIKEGTGNSSTKSPSKGGDISDKRKSGNTTSPNLPPGIFGETKKVSVGSHVDESQYDLASLNKTIKLLKQYLNDGWDEFPEEKTEVTKNLGAKDRT